MTKKEKEDRALSEIANHREASTKEWVPYNKAWECEKSSKKSEKNNG